MTKGKTTVFDGYGVTVSELIARAFRTLGRPVIDLTRLSGRFDIHLEFAAADAPDTGDDAGPSVFTAVQEQLGLKTVGVYRPGGTSCDRPRGAALPELNPRPSAVRHHPSVSFSDVRAG